MKLKNIAVIFFAVLISACHKDLNVQQRSAIISTNMWQTEGDAVASMYGMYAQFRTTFSTDYIYWGDYRAGTYGRGIQFAASANNLYNNVMTGTDALGTNWGRLYTTINDCNQLLKYTPGIPFNNEQDRNKVMANAYFARAFCYFYIVRIWGDAPLLLDGFESDKQEGLFPERTDASEIYAQIALDIDKALELMPPSIADRTTASAAAINMLKADYYLWIYKTRNAGTAALTLAGNAVDAVLANTNYELLDDYAPVFASKGNKEIIFAIHFQKDEFEGGYPQDYLIPLGNFPSSPSLIESHVKVGSNAQWYCFSPSFQGLLREIPEDTRTPVSLASYTDAALSVTYTWINKFPGEWTNETRYFTSDIPIYRFAEAILFKAEIENEQGGDPVTEINKIARRAYKIDNYYPASLSKEEISEVILKERMKEFAAEGKSWWDHIRLGFAFSKIPSLSGRQNETNVLLWPVNASTLNGNPKISQTEGFN